MVLRILNAWPLEAFGHEQESLAFSGSDTRVGDRNHSQIDKFYVNDYLRTQGGLVGILIGTTHYDHEHVILVSKESRRRGIPPISVLESLVQPSRSKYDRVRRSDLAASLWWMDGDLI